MGYNVDFPNVDFLIIPNIRLEQTARKSRFYVRAAQGWTFHGPLLRPVRLPGFRGHDVIVPKDL